MCRRAGLTREALGADATRSALRLLLVALRHLLAALRHVLLPVVWLAQHCARQISLALPSRRDRRYFFAICSSFSERMVLR